MNDKNATVDAVKKMIASHDADIVYVGKAMACHLDKYISEVMIHGGMSRSQAELCIAFFCETVAALSALGKTITLPYYRDEIVALIARVRGVFRTCESTHGEANAFDAIHHDGACVKKTIDISTKINTMRDWLEEECE